MTLAMSQPTFGDFQLLWEGKEIDGILVQLCHFSDLNFGWQKEITCSTRRAHEAYEAGEIDEARLEAMWIIDAAHAAWSTEPKPYLMDIFELADPLFACAEDFPSTIMTLRTIMSQGYAYIEHEDGSYAVLSRVPYLSIERE